MWLMNWIVSKIYLSPLILNINTVPLFFLNKPYCTLYDRLNYLIWVQIYIKKNPFDALWIVWMSVKYTKNTLQSLKVPRDQFSIYKRNFLVIGHLNGLKSKQFLSNQMELHSEMEKWIISRLFLCTLHGAIVLKMNVLIKKNRGKFHCKNELPKQKFMAIRLTWELFCLTLHTNSWLNFKYWQEFELSVSPSCQSDCKKLLPG